MNTQTVELDERDREIRDTRLIEWNEIESPRVGDFIKMRDGTLRRFTHDWGDGLQTTVAENHPCAGDQSFYFGGSYVSFSGSLDPTIPLHNIKRTPEYKPGSFWFFHHDWAQAHNGVHFRLLCRVYEEVKP